MRDDARSFASEKGRWKGDTTSMSGHSVYREKLRVTLKKTPTSKDDDRSRNVMDLPKFVTKLF